MPRWNGREVIEAGVIAPQVTYFAYLRSREIMRRLLKSDAEKAELAVEESVSTTK